MAFPVVVQAVIDLPFELVHTRHQFLVRRLPSLPPLPFSMTCFCDQDPRNV